MAFQLLKTLAVLCAVLAMIFALAYVLKKFNLVRATGDNGSAGWRVLGMKALGPKRIIYVMEVGTKLLLIGGTDKSLSSLMEVSDPVEREVIIDALTHKKTLPSFKDFLKRAES